MTDSERHKVALMGPSSAGKTSIMLRFASGTFAEDQEPTVGAAFATKDIAVNCTTVTLNIWDTAGQERFKSLVPKYARGSSAIIVVFDVTQPESLKAAQNIIENEKNEYGMDVVWFLVANKCDCPLVVDIRSVQEWSRSNNVRLFRTSAKTGEGIDLLFMSVGEEVIGRNKSADERNLIVAVHQEKRSGCC